MSFDLFSARVDKLSRGKYYNIVASIMLVIICLLPGAGYAAIDMSVGRSDVAAYTGSFKTGIPIAVAPGRAGLQPSLSLQYTSGMGNGLYGMGWQLDIARIERSIKSGRPGYTNNDTFVLIMKGARQTLVKQASGEFRVRNEGAFLRIRKQGNGWLVQDKSGTKYYFGLDDAAQQSRWPATVAQAFSWHLSKVVDMNGNVMRYFYLNDGNGIRIAHINYAPGNKVVFAYEARSDVSQNYRSAYLQRTGVRLKSVKSYAGAALAQYLELTYGQAANDSRSLLTQAIVHDPEGKLPNQITQFSYAEQQVNAFTGAWEKTPQYVQSFRRWRWRSGQRKIVIFSNVYHYADMNGDGLAEMLSISNHSSILVGYGTMPNTPWTIPEPGVGKYCTSYQVYHTRGRVRGRYQKGYQIRLPSVCISKAQYHPLYSRFHPVYNPRALVDINGDGLPDWAVKTASGAWHVYLNYGSAFNTSPQIWSDPSGKAGKYLLDVNGDGLPDLLDSSWNAYINLGDHFSSTAISTAVTAAPYDASVTQILTPALWRSTPLMSAKTNVQTGLTQAIAYQVQSGIANAPSLKLTTVARVTTSGPAVETRSVAYTYAGGLYAKSLKEFRGFATVTATDDQGGHVTTTNYHQDIILQGRPKMVETSLIDGRLISRVINTWSSKQYDGGKRHFPYILNSTSESYELDGSLVTSSVTSNTYDDYGNLINSSVNNGGFSTKIANAYSNNGLCGIVPSTTRKWVPGVVPWWVSYYYGQWPWYRQYLINYFKGRGHWQSVTTQVRDPNCWILGKLTDAQVTKTTPTGDTGTRISKFSYDGKGRLLSEIIEPVSNIWQKTAYGYDAYGNRTTTTVTGADITARTTTVAYDANGMFPASTTNALGHKENYTWDARFGAKLSLTGPNGLTTHWQYDGFGRKIRENRADGTFTAIDFSNVPVSITTTSSGSNPSTIWYDAMGRKIKSVSTAFDGSLVYSAVDYDPLGRKWKEYLPYTTAPGLFTEYAYDTLNRPIQVINPNQNIATTRYNGLSVTSINAKGQSKITVKNVLGKVISVTDAAKGMMTYAYDAFGNLKQTTDAAGNVTAMIYDIRGRKVFMTDRMPFSAMNLAG